MLFNALAVAEITCILSRLLGILILKLPTPSKVFENSYKSGPIVAPF